MTLANLEGAGCIRRIFVGHGTAAVARQPAQTLIRMYWDGSSSARR